MTKFADLPDRAVIEIAGPDRLAFLQGLVSNDVALAAPGRAVWAALLTPQGKWLADFFIFADDGRLLLDCERGQADMLVQRLTRHRLRAKVAVSRTDWPVHVGWDGPLPEAGLVAPDPRLAAAGWRLLGPSAQAVTADAVDYDRHRLVLGLPDGSRDLESDKTVLLEAGFDELNGISWTKGCYMGQELTARTRYRGLIKRRLVPVRIEGDVNGASDVTQDGNVVGSLRSQRDGIGLASLRLLAIQAAAPLIAGEARLTITRPGWLNLPLAEDAAPSG